MNTLNEQGFRRFQINLTYYVEKLGANFKIPVTVTAVVYGYLSRSRMLA